MKEDTWLMRERPGEYKKHDYVTGEEMRLVHLQRTYN